MITSSSSSYPFRSPPSWKLLFLLLLPCIRSLSPSSHQAHQSRRNFVSQSAIIRQSHQWLRQFRILHRHSLPLVRWTRRIKLPSLTLYPLSWMPSQFPGMVLRGGRVAIALPPCPHHHHHHQFSPTTATKIFKIIQPQATTPYSIQIGCKDISPSITNSKGHPSPKAERYCPFERQEPGWERVCPCPMWDTVHHLPMQYTFVLPLMMERFMTTWHTIFLDVWRRFGPKPKCWGCKLMEVIMINNNSNKLNHNSTIQKLDYHQSASWPERVAPQPRIPICTCLPPEPPWSLRHPLEGMVEWDNRAMSLCWIINPLV